MRAVAWGVVVLMGVSGCLGRKSSLLLERQARGPLDEERTVATAVTWHLTPLSQTQTKQGVEITVTHATPPYLRDLFNNKAIFGPYAGASPYFPEHLVFYVKVANRSDQRLRLSPEEFIVVDDRGNQYSTVSTDYVTAFAEYKHGASTTTRGLLENASPGYFGFSFPVGKLVASKPQGRFALLQQSGLQSGSLYPGVVYDGLVAFWNPASTAKVLRVLVTNVKTNFNANNEPTLSLEFPFEFDAVKQ